MAGSCLDDPDAVYPLRAPDRLSFEEEAGPLLARRCGDGGCHAEPERPLSLYSPGHQRLSPGDTGYTDPLTPAEWDANYDAVRGFLDDAHPRHSLLLRKPLGHGHTVVFEAASDPEFQAVEQWAWTYVLALGAAVPR